MPVRLRKPRAPGLIAACLVALAGPLRAGGLEDAVAAHGACAEAGRPSANCAEIVAGHCLADAGTMRELTACRAAAARALEARAADLAARIAGADPALRARAAEIMAGAEREIAAACDAYAGRMASPGGGAHDVRCALMAAHLKVWHLQRLLAATARDA